jgi:hypothetical protein
MRRSMPLTIENFQIDRILDFKITLIRNDPFEMFFESTGRQRRTNFVARFVHDVKISSTQLEGSEVVPAMGRANATDQKTAVQQVIPLRSVHPPCGVNAFLTRSRKERKEREEV